MTSLNKENLTSVDALRRLIEGNRRYVSGTRSVAPLLRATQGKRFAVEGQFPFVIVVASSDSRVPVEGIFDCGPGELFVLRTFGTLVDPYVIASIEYGVINFATHLIVLLGTSSSGAIRLSMESDTQPLPIESPHLQNVVNQIKPSIKRARVKEHHFGAIQKGSDEEKALWDKLEQDTNEIHLQNMTKELLSGSRLLQRHVKGGDLDIVTAFYSLTTGQVELELTEAMRSQVAGTSGMTEGAEGYVRS